MIRSRRPRATPLDPASTCCYGQMPGCLSTRKLPHQCGRICVAPWSFSSLFYSAVPPWLRSCLQGQQRRRCAGAAAPKWRAAGSWEPTSASWGGPPYSGAATHGSSISSWPVALSCALAPVCVTGFGSSRACTCGRAWPWCSMSCPSTPTSWLGRGGRLWGWGWRSICWTGFILLQILPSCGECRRWV